MLSHCLSDKIVEELYDDGAFAKLKERFKHIASTEIVRHTYFCAIAS
jgi:hypothetical protein